MFWRTRLPGIPISARSGRWTISLSWRYAEGWTYLPQGRTQLEAFVSPCPDPLAVAIDALSMDWEIWQVIYLFPPFQLLEIVVDRLTSFTGRGFLVAPFWPTASWFVQLEERCSFRFPLREEAFLWQTTDKGMISLPNHVMSIYNLHAWIL